MRYRHSRIHTTDPRRVVLVGCSLPPSLPPPCQEKVYKHTYQVPYLTSVLVPPYLLLLYYYYVHIQVQYIREGGYNDVYSIIVSLYQLMSEPQL